MADWHLWLPPALTKRRFRIYVAGHTVSVIGGWIQQIALAWLIFRLTGSIFLLGLSGFLLNIFYLLLGPWAGLAADRLPRLQALIGIDIALATLAVLLAVMGLSGVTDIGAYLAVATLIGVFNAFEMPMRQTLLKDIVEDRALVTERRRHERAGLQRRPHDRPGDRRRAAGLRLRGLVLRHQRGELRRHHRRAAGHAPAAPPRRGVRRRRPAGAWPPASAVLGSFPAVRYLLPTVAAVGLFATPYVPLMPSIVAHFFDGQSSTVGLLMSAAGVGALASSCYLAVQPGYGQQLRLVTAAPLAVGLSLAAFAWSRSLPLSLLLIAALAAAVLVAVNATNALLQQSVPDEWRGRVIGVYSMSFAGTAPIGGLFSGWLADHIGLAITLTINGALIIAAGLLSRWRLHNHPEALRGLMRSLSRP